MSEAAARSMALSRGDKLRMPVKARTLTVAEFRRNERRLVAVLWGIYVLFVGWILIGLALDGGQESREMLAIVLPVTIAGGAGLAFLSRWRLRKHAGYRDHLIAIELTDHGIRIEWNAEAYALGYEDVVYRLYWQTMKSNTDFLGIRLDSPIGPLDVVDRWYLGGRNAAAAIVAGHDKWYHLRRLA